MGTTDEHEQEVKLYIWGCNLSCLLSLGYASVMSITADVHSHKGITMDKENGSAEWEVKTLSEDPAA